MHIAGPEEISSFFSGLRNIYYSLGKISKKDKAAYKAFRATMMNACYSLICKYVSALYNRAYKEALDARQTKRIFLLSES